jgi:hypothetical protein
MATGISAPSMGAILHTTNAAYSPTDIGQALSATYPLLTASDLVSILTGPALFPAMTRDEVITLLTSLGYSQAETLTAVTAEFPFIQTGFATLTGTLGKSASQTVLSYLKWTMSYADAAFWYDQSGGPEVSVDHAEGGQGIFLIGDPTVPRFEHASIPGQYKASLFPEPDVLKQQIICLMAYVLQYPYPPNAQ